LVIIGAVISLSVVAIGNWKLDLPQLLRRVITLLIYTHKHYVQEKHLILVQKSVIRDVGGFNGVIYEYTHMTYANSTYGNVVSAS